MAKLGRMRTECVEPRPLVRFGPRDSNVKGVHCTALEAFKGHRPVRPLLRVMSVSTYPDAVSCEELPARRLVGRESLQKGADAMHQELSGMNSASRRCRTIVRNKKSGVQALNFEVGDFVLVRRPKTRDTNCRLRGKGLIASKASQSSCTYEAETILTGKIEIVHVPRSHL